MAYEESPHSKERRLGELAALRELNARFENILKSVRAENHQLELNCEDLANKEDLQTKINDFLVDNIEGLKSQLQQLTSHNNSADKTGPHKPHNTAVVDKLKNDSDHVLDEKRKALREWALKVCDLKVNNEKNEANLNVLGKAIKNAENITSALQTNRDGENQRGAALNAAIAKAQNELKNLIAECKQHEAAIAEFHIPDVTKAHATKVVEYLAAKEADLASQLHKMLDDERKAQQKIYDDTMKAIAANSPTVGEEELLKKKNRALTELARINADNAQLQAKVDKRAQNLKALRDALDKKIEQRDRIVVDIEEQKKLNAFSNADLNAKRKRDNDLEDMIGNNVKKLQAAKDMSDIKHKEKLIKEGREAIAQMKRAIASTSVDIQKEILEYQEILGYAEKKFEAPNKNAAFPFAAPPGFDQAAPLQPQPDSHRRTMKKGTASAKKQTTPSKSVAASSAPVNFTPTPKKRRREDDTPVRIVQLDPIYQRVVIENSSDEVKDISGWRLVNVTYAFSHQIPFGTVLEPSATFTFCQRPSEKKKKSARGAAKEKATKVLPPLTAYWDVGGRDVSWPMENARAVLKDREGNMVHEYSLAKQK